MDYVTLNNGVQMPMQGFGVFRYQMHLCANRLFPMPLRSVTGLLIRHLCMGTNGLLVLLFKKWYSAAEFIHYNQSMDIRNGIQANHASF